MKVQDVWNASDGRVRLLALPVVGAIAGLVLFVIAVLPAGAGAGAASTAGVQPAEVDLGGQPNDCATSEVDSAATYELRIENPQDGNIAAAAPAGVSFDLTITDDDKLLEFTVNGPVVVFDIVVKGGSKSTHFDYDASTVGPVTTDSGIHAPTRGNGNNLHNISHVSFCYEEAVPLTGTVQFDANADANLLADTPEEGRVVRAYSGGSQVAEATTDASGDFTMLVSPNAGVLSVCEDVRDGYIQIGTYPDSCAGVSGAELGGYSVDVSGAGQAGLDFDNALEVCGQVLTADDDEFIASFELFGDATTECDRKAGDLFIEGGVVKLPIIGPAGGTVAGFGRIEKTFAGGPDDFTPLEFSAEDDGTFVVLQWCGLRLKEAGDGGQFDTYVPSGQYPNLEGVSYATEPDVSCKVYEEERIDGTQITIVYFDADPFWQ